MSLDRAAMLLHLLEKLTASPKYTAIRKAVVAELEDLEQKFAAEVGPGLASAPAQPPQNKDLPKSTGGQNVPTASASTAQRADGQPAPTPQGVTQVDVARRI